MKQLKMVLLMALAVFCFTTTNAQSKKTKVINDKVVYQCPMKCEGDKTYKKAGKCPTCKMKLKAKAKSNASAKTYQCPMKCEGDKTYDKAGKCPKCNMKLAKVETKKEVDNHHGHNHN